LFISSRTAEEDYLQALGEGTCSRCELPNNLL